MIKSIEEIIHKTPLDSRVALGGWIRNKRASKDVIFLDLQDGSQQAPLQLVGDPSVISSAVQRVLTTGASVRSTFLNGVRGALSARLVSASRMRIRQP